MVLEKLNRVSVLDAELTANGVTEQQLNALNAQIFEVEKAQARLSSLLPALRLSAVDALSAQASGKPLELVAGEVRTLPLKSGWTLEVPGLMSIELEPMPSVEEEEAKLASEMERLSEACQRLGLREPSEAAARQRQRQQAQDELARCQDAVQASLGSFNLEQLHCRIESLKLLLGQASRSRKIFGKIWKLSNGSSMAPTML
jgi:hypothetical protein